MRGMSLLVALLLAPGTAAATTQTLFTSMGGAALPNAATTIFSALTGNGGNDRWTDVTNEASSGSLLPAGTLNSFRFTSTYDTNSYDVGGPGTNIIATVMKNGVPTALTCTVTGAAGSGAAGQEQCDVVPVVVSPPIAVAAGDRFTVRVQMQGTPANPGGAAWSVDFTPAVPNTTVMAGSHNAGNFTARFLPPGVSTYTAAFAIGADDDAGANVRVPIAGNITGILCRSSVPRTSTLKTEVYVNGAAVGALDCNVTPAAGTNPVLVAATRALAVGDTVSLKFNNNGGGMIFASLLFAPVTAGRWWNGFSSGGPVNWGPINVLPFTGYARTSCPWNGACDSWPPPNVNIESMRVDLGTVPAAGRSLDVSVARHIEDPPGLNSAIATSVHCNFTAGSANSCTVAGPLSVDAVNPNDYWELWARPTGSPAPSTLKISTVFSRDGGSPVACNDGADNDGDGDVDFPADPGCSGVGDGYEQVEFTNGGTHVIDAAASVADSVVVTNGAPGAQPSYLELRQGGVVGGSLTTSDAALVSIRGGSLLGDFIGEDTATLELISGSIGGDVQLRGFATATLRGGQVFGDLYAWDQSLLEIRGSGFNLPFGDLGDAIGRITGVLLDGTPISIDFERAENATIRLVPEPGAQLLAVIAVLTLSGFYLRSKRRPARSR